MPEIVPVAVGDLIALDRRVAQYRIKSYSALTRARYKEIWQTFVCFCAPKDAWAATPLDVARWMVSEVVEWELSPATVRTRVTALNCYFETLGKGSLQGRPGLGTRPSPARHSLVRQTLRGLERQHGRPRQRKMPLLLDSLEKMIDQQPETLIGRRNRALLVIGWGAALRGYELEMLDLESDGAGHDCVEVREEGVIVTLRRSKANLGRRGPEDYGIPARPTAPRYCPVRLTRSWLAAAGHASGPFFRAIGGSGTVRPRRLERQQVRRIVKASARAIGLDAGAVGSHSLRAGCLTWLFLEGVNPFRIQKHSGHGDLKALMDYIRPPRDPQNSPLAETRWAR